MLHSLVLFALATAPVQGQAPQQPADSLCAAPAPAAAPAHAVKRRPAAHRPLAATHRPAAQSHANGSASAGVAHKRGTKPRLAARPKPAPRTTLPQCRPAALAAQGGAAGDPPTETGTVASDTALLAPAAAPPIPVPVAPNDAGAAAAVPAGAAADAASAAPAPAAPLPAETVASDSSHGSLLPFVPLLGVGMFLALTGGGDGGSDLTLPPQTGGTPPGSTPPGSTPPGGGPPPIITPPLVPPVTTTPEPATIVLVATGIGALGAARARRRRND